MLKFILRLLSALAIAAPCAAATFTVTSNADTAGSTCAATCTLRQAITAANATGASDTINFNVATGGADVLIQPATPLPVITQPLSIDGYTQGDASVNTAVSGSNAQLRVRLHGAAIATTSVAGLSACASTVSIRGLSIQWQRRNPLRWWRLCDRHPGVRVGQLHRAAHGRHHRRCQFQRRRGQRRHRARG